MSDIPRTCWITLLALKIFYTIFAAYEGEWRLTSMKAKQYLKNYGNIQDVEERL